MPRLALAMLFLAPLLRADTLKVPSQFATIQQAVDAAVAGDVIVVSKGPFVGPVFVTGKSDIELRGKGLPTLDGTGAGSTLDIEDCTNVLVKGFEITNALTQGIFVVNGIGVRITKCHTLGMPVGIHVRDGDTVTVDHNQVVGATSVGIQLSSGVGGGPVACTVRANHVEDTTNLAIMVDGQDGVIERNVIKPASGDGISSHINSLHARFARNRVLDATNNGFVLEGGQHELDRNKVLRAGGDSFVFTGNSSDFVLTHNRTTEPGGTGFLVDGDDMSFDHDRVLKPIGDGVELGKETCHLKNVRVLHGLGNGIEVNADSNTFDDCRATGCGYDGFAVTGTLNTFTKCRAKGSGNLDLDEAEGLDNTYTDCKFKTTSP